MMRRTNMKQNLLATIWSEGLFIFKKNLFWWCIWKVLVFLDVFILKVNLCYKNIRVRSLMSHSWIWEKIWLKSSCRKIVAKVSWTLNDDEDNGFYTWPELRVSSALFTVSNSAGSASSTFFTDNIAAGDVRKEVIEWCVGKACTVTCE